MCHNRNIGIVSDREKGINTDNTTNSIKSLDLVFKQEEAEVRTRTSTKTETEYDNGDRLWWNKRIIKDRRDVP